MLQQGWYVKVNSLVIHPLPPRVPRPICRQSLRRLIKRRTSCSSVRRLAKATEVRRASARGRQRVKIDHSSAMLLDT